MERARQRELAETNFNPQAAEALRAVSEAVAPPATQQRPHSSGGRGGDMVFAAPQTAMLSTSGSLFPPVRPGSAGRLPPLVSSATGLVGSGGPRAMLLTSSLVHATGPPSIDTQELVDVLISTVKEVQQVRQALPEDEAFTSRVAGMIQAQLDLQLYPALKKRDEEFERFKSEDFAAVVRRVGKLEGELLATKQHLQGEKTKVASLQARMLGAESAITEKAEQQELDALLRSVITTIGSIGQRIGEAEANLASCRVAQTQSQEQLVVLKAEVVVAREKETVDVAALESSLNELHNKQEQLATKVEKWKFGEGTSLMDAMWKRSRTERVAQLTTAGLDVLREREAINLDDTQLELADWSKVFGKLARCRGDGKTLQLRRLSLHNCRVPEAAADELGTVLAYSMPELEYLSLRGNATLGHHGWSAVFSRIAAGGGLPKLATLNLQECQVPTSCRRELQTMFQACPALLEIEVGGGEPGSGEDEWIEELWHSVDSGSGGGSGGGADGGYSQAGTDKEASGIASRVAAASALATTAGNAFSSPLRPPAAVAALVGAGMVGDAVGQEEMSQGFGFEKAMARQRGEQL